MGTKSTKGLRVLSEEERKNLFAVVGGSDMPRMTLAEYLAWMKAEKQVHAAGRKIG